MPRVSVIIPCYNYANLVGRAIQSVLDQTYRDFEVIVVDDGSTDNTPEVVGRFGERIRYIRQANQGPNAARNTGIRATDGEFVALLDADDEWLPHKLERQIEVMDAKPNVGLMYANIYLIEGQSGAIIGTYPPRFFHEGYVLPHLFLHQFVPSPTPLIRRKVFERVGYFDPKTIGSDDWEMWLRIAAQFNFAYVLEPLAKYTVHASWGSRTTYLTYERDMLAFFEKATRDHPAELGPLYRYRLSTFAEQLGWHLIRNGERAAGFKRLELAISYCPWRPKPYLLLVLVMVGPRMTSEHCRLGRVSYLQGKHSLFTDHYSQARTEFIRSILSDPWGNPKAYAGLLLALIGRPGKSLFARWLRLDSIAKGPRPDNDASFQQW